MPYTCYGEVVTILPRLPSADEEYTPEQRRIIDAQLRAAEKGPLHGPFENASEAIAYMKRELKKRSALRKSKRSE
jgi:hypothetical protein